MLLVIILVIDLDKNMDILLREGLFGRTLNYLSNNRIFPYSDALTSTTDAASHQFSDSTQYFAGPDDLDMPRNWLTLTKAFVMADVMLLNFSFYAASAIFTPSIPLIEQDFGATTSQGTLGLSLFVIAYGIGPLLVSQLFPRTYQWTC